MSSGGRTVFPRIGAGVAPEAGSAVFWYNLHNSGEPDRLTLHGACPVLYGTKWGKSAQGVSWNWLFLMVFVFFSDNLAAFLSFPAIAKSRQIVIFGIQKLLPNKYAKNR